MQYEIKQLRIYAARNIWKLLQITLTRSCNFGRIFKYKQEATIEPLLIYSLTFDLFC